MTVKRFLFIICLLMAGLSSMAQRQVVKNLTTFDDKRLHFGFTLGVNALDFGIQHYPTLGDNPNFDIMSPPETVGEKRMTANQRIRADVATLTPGFTVGIVTNLRLSESLDLRFLPGMSFSERKLTYRDSEGFLKVDDGTDFLELYSIKSTLLDFPLLIKYKSRRMNNQRPYLIGGAAYRIDISKAGKDELVKLNPSSFSLEAGMGWDMYLQFFRLSTELKFSFGMNNILDEKITSTTVNQTYSNAFSRLTSDMFILSFHFE